MSISLKIADLRQLQAFQGETDETLKSVLEVAEDRQLQADHVLLDIGVANDCLYIILEGSVRVEIEADDSPFVTHIERGECVGELSVLDGQPTTARVIADEPTRVLVLGRDDMWRLIDTGQGMARNLLHLLSGRIRKNDEALSHSVSQQQRHARSARVDSLTGLYNRYWLDEMFPRLIERANASGDALSYLMFDVDHFKRFNDTYGHLAGDEVLRTLGTIVLGGLRPDDSAVRYGGEEFAIILPGLDRAQALEVAQRLCRTIESKTKEILEPQGIPGVTISAGLSELGESKTAKEMIAEADAALYRAKNAGRNRVEG